MGVLIASTFGLVIWIVLWSIGVNAVDSFLLTIAIFLIAMVTRAIRQNRPGYRGDDAADQAISRR